MPDQQAAIAAAQQLLADNADQDGNVNGGIRNLVVEMLRKAGVENPRDIVRDNLGFGERGFTEGLKRAGQVAAGGAVGLLTGGPLGAVGGATSAAGRLNDNKVAQGAGLVLTGAGAAGLGRPGGLDLPGGGGGGGTDPLGGIGNDAGSIGEIGDTGTPGGGRLGRIGGFARDNADIILGAAGAIQNARNQSRGDRITDEALALVRQGNATRQGLIDGLQGFQFSDRSGDLARVFDDPGNPFSAPLNRPAPRPQRPAKGQPRNLGRRSF